MRINDNQWKSGFRLIQEAMGINSRLIWESGRIHQESVRINENHQELARINEIQGLDLFENQWESIADLFENHQE